jgi:hypothetical protein
MAEATGQITAAASPRWARGIRLGVLSLLAAALVLSLIDSARSWKTKHMLANAAEQAAKVTVSNPLNVRNCRDATPCPVQWAAAAAQQSLIRGGVVQAACIDPKQPNFSGVLVWVFSCDGSSTCNTSDGTVCVKVDMTPVSRAENGEWIPFTRVTVQCPHEWELAAVLKLLPGKPTGPFPKSVSASALLRNYSVS